MTRDAFCKLLQEQLNEATEITPETAFKDLDSYGSLSSVLVLQLVEEKLGVSINPRAFRSIKSVNDIFNSLKEE